MNVACQYRGQMYISRKNLFLSILNKQFVYVYSAVGDHRDRLLCLDAPFNKLIMQSFHFSSTIAAYHSFVLLFFIEQSHIIFLLFI